MIPESPISLKERSERQIIAELLEDDIVAGMLPTKQNEDTEKKFPRMAVVVTPGKEVSPGAKIFNMSGVVALKFKFPEQKASDFDNVMSRVMNCLSIAQARGDYGLILDGERPSTFTDHTTRERAVAFRLIAG